MILAHIPKIDLYHALVANKWDVRATAKALGKDRSWVYRIMQRHGLRNMIRKPVITRLILENTMERKHRCVNAVAAELGIDSSTCHRLINKWGIKRAERHQKWRPKNASHCKRGHKFTLANTYKNPRGFKVCRRCQTERALRVYYEKKGAKNVQHIRHEHAGASVSDLHASARENDSMQI